MLFHTLREMGGEMARARRVAWFADTVSTALRRELDRMDVEIRQAGELLPGIPHANKVQMLDPDGSAEHLVLLDTDIVVARDFASEVTGSTVRLRPGFYDLLGERAWRRLYRLADAPLPADRVQNPRTLEWIFPYFNSGVLIVPRALVGRLREAWERWAAWLSHRARAWPWKLRRNRATTDQFALALALADRAIPYDCLTPEMNFETLAPTAAELRPDEMNPYLFHHHHHWGPGYQVGLMFDYRCPRGRLREVNGRLAELADQ